MIRAHPRVLQDQANLLRRARRRGRMPDPEHLESIRTSQVQYFLALRLGRFVNDIDLSEVAIVEETATEVPPELMKGKKYVGHDWTLTRGRRIVAIPVADPSGATGYLFIDKSGEEE